MFRKVAPLLALVFAAGAVQAETLPLEEVSLSNATLVVYREDEFYRTGHLDYDIHVGEAGIGRLSERESLVVSGEAGEYNIGSSMGNTRGVTLQLKPGATHYVMARTLLLGDDVVVELVEVEEQVARTQLEELESAI